jgi:hypothetical protein
MLERRTQQHDNSLFSHDWSSYSNVCAMLSIHNISPIIITKHWSTIRIAAESQVNLITTGRHSRNRWCFCWHWSSTACNIHRVYLILLNPNQISAWKMITVIGLVKISCSHLPPGCCEKMRVLSSLPTAKRSKYLQVFTKGDVTIGHVDALHFSEVLV